MPYVHQDEMSTSWWNEFYRHVYTFSFSLILRLLCGYMKICKLLQTATFMGIRNNTLQKKKPLEGTVAFHIEEALSWSVYAVSQI